MTVDPATLDWANLGFQYVATPWRFQEVWEAGSWSAGELVAEATLTVEEGCTGIHYGQQCFEGMKAFAFPDGRAALFRPDRNAARFKRSAARLLMPEVPEELFLSGVEECIRANLAFRAVTVPA